ncbi:TPA: prepilin peptidase [Candidatus Collierbacteria bacterium]|uniref:Type 4 prepilin-like protein leader peptide-processing enzyme n=1 Tax=Candidatus Collierbacteria bacterium GW2011_GWB2_44_22 TaxID=1618387 RepID=A0A0G1HZL5_9BACT|nr:MAG: Type 4 prepilin-like protein leader peptide-processing enzyme [Candidatus Collierbacteria bacterium GW2011_GWA2_44_13]KKT51534.1 MAG: Type 4 prepilin-like protein leader peptide-processing enzyme [Candidatus Collierbacteria bacterium GW2011_GWB1_44_197]KKT52013.1 MAG: Type 4 prepilin-like protein leader peptide-processing enzyme [Candidatus Collierbacteria bacterium GW2011_GWB2_44_22]KKT62129.1 MAG: Type 4 prepilin-like protein leader peptide-processing enzyme [Candidatus Collierbacteria
MNLIILFLFGLGLVWGSFLNVVIWRMPRGKSVADGRSICPKCKHVLAWKYNIPLLSYVFLRGKCAYCHKSISIRYPLIEFMTGIFFVWWFAVGFNFFKLVGSPWSYIQPVFWLVTGLVMFTILVIDLLYMVIPFGLNLTLFSLALAYRVGLTSFGIMNSADFFRALASGAGVCLLFVFLQAVTKAVKKVDGFGLGDIYLAPSLGLLLGWPKILPGMFSAFVLGSVVGLILIATKKKKMTQYLPFGPFLIIGTAISLLWGSAIWTWYMSLIV